MGCAPPAVTSTRTGGRPLTLALCLCVTLVVGMVSAINLAIPSLAASDLRPTATDLLWVVDGYVVVFACLLVPAGAAADRYGRKRVLLAGLAVFAAGLMACALASNAAMLLCGRVVSGVGASAVLPTTLALMLQGVEPTGRQRAIGVWASMTGVAAVAGNLGGGAAVQFGSWRALFAGTLPLAVLAAVLVARLAPRLPAVARRIDPVGSLLFTAGCVALLYGLANVPAAGWSAGRTLVGFGFAITLLGCWVWCELRAEHPMLNPRVFTSRSLRGSALGMTSAFLGMFGLMYLNGQYLQYAKGYSVLGAGVRLMPMAAALWLGPRIGVPLALRLGGRVAVGLGLGLVALGLLGASLVDAMTPYLGYALCIAVIAAGCGVATPCLSDGIMSGLPREDSGLGSGLQSVTRELGSALGVAVVGSVLNARFTTLLPAEHGPGAPSTVAAATASHPDPALAEGVVIAFTRAMSDGLRVAAALVAVAGLVTVAWLPRRAPARNCR